MSSPDTTPTLLRRAADLLSHYVLPLYRTDQFDRPQQVGSGFIVRFDGQHYLVTAAHVLDLRHQGGLYFYAGKDSPTSISGRACQSGSGGSRDDDQIDVGVVQLDSSVPSPPYRNIAKMAVDAHELWPEQGNRFGNSYLLLGFPATKNVFRRADGVVIARAYAYLGESSDKLLYKRLSLSTEEHLLVKFDQRVGFDSAGRQIVFPKPHGMSGGPIFHYSSINSADFKFSFPIVGIATRHKAREKAIQGTDIAVAARLIGELHVWKK